jgi:DNA polymerase-3 subunit epsilon
MEPNYYNYLEMGLDDNLFAIIDCETTGFSPRRGDKIVEIAIITINLNGEIVDKYETLINPNRAIGASHIHNINAEMVEHAPRIEEVIEDIIYHLNDKTIVGHNIEFDLRFLNHELSKYLRSEIKLNGVCTMQMIGFVEPTIPSRGLDSVCNYYNIENSNSHTALGDCYATVSLFNIIRSNIIERYGNDAFLQNTCRRSWIKETPEPNNLSFKRDQAKQKISNEFNRMRDMIQRLSHNPADSVPVQGYLSLLDNILADRFINEHETIVLYDFISDNNISQDQVNEIHHEYIRKLVRVYLLDNVLSESETNDLEKTCSLLCVDQCDLKKLIEFEKAKISKEQVLDQKCSENLLYGKSVCFTGQLISSLNGKGIDRLLAHQLATERGLLVKNGVSKDLDYLIMADPHSLSGKAKKAKEYGVNILAESVFWNMVNISVE